MDRLTASPTLSQRCPTLRDLYMAGELEWSEGEPAMNLYEAPGLFGAHKDHMALTVLVPLTAPSAFAGGKPAGARLIISLELTARTPTATP